MERDGLVALRILFAVLTATLAGYAFARLQFAGKACTSQVLCIIIKNANVKQEHIRKGNIRE